MAWNLETGKQMCLLEGHSAEVSCVVVTQRGRCTSSLLSLQQVLDCAESQDPLL